MRKKRARVFAVAALCAGLAGVAPAATPPPDPVVVFSRGLPRFFEQLGGLVASERMTQTLISERDATIARKRLIESDFEVSHLAEDPTMLWEFRFVKTVDGKPSGAERAIEDFFRLRQPDAAAERGQIVALAMGKSLPGCYWHNLTLMLLAFGEANLGNFEWKPFAGGWAFRQVRGAGISENLYDPSAARHYPDGLLKLSPDGTWARSLEMTFVTGPRVAHVVLTFSPPAAPGEPALPLRYQAAHENLLTRFAVDRAVFEYSNFRKFTVSTQEAPAAAR